ncbi:ABC transporter permease [Jeotgalibacillus sp. S-D1]|uniref:ABC transporter permease n=1 Tax=Jeotgalibacillus sp. S-D1 TaxID=2552189 RepID=UPI00105A963E|nr:ABC transporter permease [Jeotgalibacillus sp. S-D1]TDL32934.1 ABC transporter permease [Jeotgalibacillus sp. S-D1]
MTFSLKRSLAIFRKDYKDVSKNLYVSTTVLMPLILAAVYGRTGVETVEVYFLVFNLTFTMVAAYVQSALIAEEKEKNTLRGLMLSPATTAEILGGKSMLSFLGTLIVLVMCAFFMEYQPGNLLIISVASLISIVFYIGIGTLIGLLTRSVMEASVAILPVAFFFSFVPLVKPFMDEYPILKAVNFFPNLQLIELANQIETGAGWGDSWSAILIILGWTVVITSFVVAVYNRKMVDH